MSAVIASTWEIQSGGRIAAVHVSRSWGDDIL
jgi:hypothetical protein